MLDVAQPILFAETELPKRPLHDPQDVREKLQSFLDKMRAAASWPWKASTVVQYREKIWPSLLQKLPEHEGGFFRVELEAEAARLDSAQ